MRKSPLYTGTGDAGTTSLVGGQRIAKNSPRVCAYGTLDELNAMIGLVQAHCTQLDDFINSTLINISCTLFNIGSYLATPSDEKKNISPTDEPTFSTELSTTTDDPTSPTDEPASPIELSTLTDLEHQIDLLDSMTPPLKLFVLPGGSIGAAHAHVARTVCRRAERDILTLTDTGAYVHPTVLTYINRLSDYLFILARYINHVTSTPEITWRRKK
ncbi:MAG: cob(I)yrinic acid a,c-diamide adenosyltransferase [Bacteroides sp.]|nr:cob(I)yrinic acid a,c-diamide adenosyltransferase [Bacteroides sp.]